MNPTLTNSAKRIFHEDFEIYKSNICHMLHFRGDIDFIKTILQDDVITQLAKNKLTAWALYLVAMLDHVSKENNIPICTKYDWLRELKLPELLIPRSIRLNMKLFNDQEIFDEAYKKAIPEFLKYNIMEGDIRNVC